MILRTIVKWNNGSELIHFLTAGRAHERLHMIKEEKEKKKKKKTFRPNYVSAKQPSGPRTLYIAVHSNCCLYLY